MGQFLQWFCETQMFEVFMTEQTERNQSAKKKSKTIGKTAWSPFQSFIDETFEFISFSTWVFLQSKTLCTCEKKLQNDPVINSPGNT